MIVRNGTLNDIDELQQLFVDTILCTCKKDYNTVQLQAWTSGIDNIERWQQVLKDQYVLIAVVNDTIVGFCTLDKGNYIDFLFVHKDYLRQGIAYQLYSMIEQKAIDQNQMLLTAEVSKTARPFFETMGFTIVNEQTVNLNGIHIANFKMNKILTKKTS